MKVSPELKEVLQRDPQAEIAVIVHVDDDPTQYVSALEAVGLSVTRAFRLTNTLAVRGSAGRISNLAEESWVTKVEVDQRMTAMGTGDATQA